MEMKHSLKSLLKYFFMLLYFTWELIFGGRKEGNFEIFVAGVKYCILRDWAGILYIVRGWKGDKATQSEPGQSRMSAKPPSHVSIFQAGSLRRHNAVKICFSRTSSKTGQKPNVPLTHSHKAPPCFLDPRLRPGPNLDLRENSWETRSPETNIIYQPPPIGCVDSCTPFFMDQVLIVIVVVNNAMRYFQI